MMPRDDWLKAWRGYCLSLERLKRSIDKMNAYCFHNWPRPYANPPEMNELERDIFFRSVDEILRDEKAKRAKDGR